MKSISVILLMGFTMLVTGCMKPMTLAEKMEPVQPNNNTSYYFNKDTTKFVQSIARNEHHLFEVGKQDESADVVMGTAYANPNTSLTKVIIADLIFSRPVQSPFAFPEASFIKQSESNALKSFQALLNDEWFKSLLKENNCGIDAYYGDDYRSAYTFHSINEGLYRRFKCNNNNLATDLVIEVIASYSKSGSDVIVNVIEKNPGERLPKLENRMHFETLDYFGSLLPADWVKIGFGFANTVQGPEWLTKVIKNGVTTYLEVPIIPGSNHKIEIERFKKEYL